MFYSNSFEAAILHHVCDSELLLDWATLSLDTRVSFSFIEKYPNLPWDYEIISARSDITTSVLITHRDIDWSAEILSRNPIITLETICALPHFEWDFEFLATTIGQGALAESGFEGRRQGCGWDKTLGSQSSVIEPSRGIAEAHRPMTAPEQSSPDLLSEDDDSDYGDEVDDGDDVGDEVGDGIEGDFPGWPNRLI